jgi:hypothetical protein
VTSQKAQLPKNKGIGSGTKASSSPTIKAIKAAFQMFRLGLWSFMNWL